MISADSIFVVLANALIVAIVIALAALMYYFGWQFVFGFGVASLVYHLGYRAKHGEWWVDS